MGPDRLCWSRQVPICWEAAVEDRASPQGAQQDAPGKNIYVLNAVTQWIMCADSQAEAPAAWRQEVVSHLWVE